MLPRERISALLDPGSPFLELSQLAGHQLYGKSSQSSAEAIMLAHTHTKFLMQAKKKYQLEDLSQASVKYTVGQLQLLQMMLQVALTPGAQADCRCNFVETSDS